MVGDIIKCLIVGYMFGCISTSYIVGKMYHIDIREHGSGNAGTTNTMRVLGKQAGILVYLGDCIKCALAILIMCYAYMRADSEIGVQLIKLVTGFGVVLGHNYPFWLKFKGGKGIAVTSAVILIVSLPTQWLCPTLCIIAFGGIVQATGYVSLGSLVVVSIFLTYNSIVYRDDKDYLTMLIFTALFTISAFYTHKANIIRLINGTENKMGAKKKQEEDDNSNSNNNIRNNGTNYDNRNRLRTDNTYSDALRDAKINPREYNGNRNSQTRNLNNDSKQGQRNGQNMNQTSANRNNNNRSNNSRNNNSRNNSKLYRQDTDKLERFCDAEVEEISNNIKNPYDDDFDIDIKDLSQYRDAVPVQRGYNNRNNGNSNNLKGNSYGNRWDM